MVTLTKIHRQEESTWVENEEVAITLNKVEVEMATGAIESSQGVGYG